MDFESAIQLSISKFDSPEFIQRIKEEDEKMVKYLPELKRINELGFLTHSSQAGHHSFGFSKLLQTDYEERQRAYVFGYLPHSVALKFIPYFNCYTDKNAMIIPIYSSYLLSSKLDIPLTIVVSENNINVQTHMAPFITIDYEVVQRNELNLSISDSCVYVFCWDSKWCRNACKEDGLFLQIIRILQQIN